ncbi:uracil-DNA glycosylase [Intrasporangium chromatireducens Q5-1]|uniref:Type-4 uracil-DNA glycosylase n=1 Tax=Intrasporangium chromatireducens Q5-1 TaxID=584657 RepID=W9GJ44_9MICO|nr:UdgX family uracil-DNA binding protein [Intrasporangium chromatireducens]EWT05162.1 uracil-DNA glycosylase [Intrasporangium chromatireducens Q5-1]
MTKRSDYPGAGPWVPDEPDEDRLRSAVQECRGCDLYLDATQGVMGDGPVPARLMLVGEQPGDQEDKQGLPFVGPAGRLLDRALGEAGIDPAGVYKTNVVKHFRFKRDGGKRIHKSPVRWQVAACEPWLLTELGLVRPEVVVLLGATAGQAVYGSGFRVGAARGTPTPWPEQLGSLEAPPTTVASAHPSSVLRSRQRDADLAALVADLVVARELLG